MKICEICNREISKDEEMKNGCDLCQVCIDDVPYNDIICVCNSIVSVPEHSIVQCFNCGFELSN